MKPFEQAIQNAEHEERIPASHNAGQGRASTRDAGWSSSSSESCGHSDLGCRKDGRLGLFLEPLELTHDAPRQGDHLRCLPNGHVITGLGMSFRDREA